MFMYNLEYIFSSAPQLPQNVLFSLFGNLVTLDTILIITMLCQNCKTCKPVLYAFFAQCV
jgi:hypothetical protein